MKIIDNIQERLKDDLVETIEKNSQVSIAASYFSIYAYQELKSQLENIDELKFIFTSPSFTTEKAKKEKREFYIPQLNREKSLYGTEFEVKLRNELTQKAIAKECAEWVRQKATFKTNITQENMGGFINVKSNDTRFTYMPINSFTTVDIGCEKGNNIYNMVNRFEAPFSDAYFKLFNEVWHNKENSKMLRKKSLKTLPLFIARIRQSLFILSRYTIFLMNFWKMFRKMCCLMKLRVLRTALYGINFTIFKKMRSWQLSISWRSIMAAFWRTVLD